MAAIEKLHEDLPPPPQVSQHLHDPAAAVAGHGAYRRMKSMDIKELLELYVQAAQTYINEMREGSVRRANRQHSVAERVLKEMKRRGMERELLLLLSHPRPAVRLWAAVDALGIEPESAKQVLESLPRMRYRLLKYMQVVLWMSSARGSFQDRINHTGPGPGQWHRPALPVSPCSEAISSSRAYAGSRRPFFCAV